MNAATALELPPYPLGAFFIDAGLVLRSPGFITAGDFIQFVQGVLISGFGRFEAYDAMISGLISTDSLRFNKGRATATMPAIATTSLTPIAVPVVGAHPLGINYVFSDATIFYGWMPPSPNSFVAHRFGNTTQVFDILVQGVGQNNSGGTDFLYIQLYYRIRFSGGSWPVTWTKAGEDAYMQKLAMIDQSFELHFQLTIPLVGENDIQFAAGFSHGGAGAGLISSGQLSVKAYN